MLSPILAWLEQPWKLFSVMAQVVFTLRFLVQWLRSERAGRSVVPDAFWTFSIAGGTMLMIYFIHNSDWAPALGQAGGLAIYLRNYWMIRRNRGREGSAALTDARALADDLRAQLGKLGDIHDRPVKIDETLERLKSLLQPSETEAL